MSSSSSPSVPASLVLSPPPPLPVYLDYNATTPLSEPVVAAMAPFLVSGVSSTLFGNPSSSHVYGASAKAKLEEARAQVARSINAADSSEILLLSGATESLNTALQGAAYAQRSRGAGNHIISCSVEHVATLNILEKLRVDGFHVTILPVDSNGSVSPQQVREALREDTVLVSLMLANNEVGTVLPLAEIARTIREFTRSTSTPHRIFLHTDASQALGKVPVDVQALDVDLLTLAGHKVYASKGVGALYVRRHSQSQGAGQQVQLHKFMVGANHESNRRAGTENVQLIAGFGAACQAVWSEELPQLMQRFEQLRAELLGAISGNLQRLIDAHGLGELYTTKPVESAAGASEEQARTGAPRPRPRQAFRVHCATVPRLSNTLSLGFLGVNAQEILRRLSGHVAASAGAACHSAAEEVELSYVLAAMGVPKEYGMGTLRLSVGRYNSLAAEEGGGQEGGEGEMQRVGRWIAQTVVQMWREQLQQQ